MSMRSRFGLAGVALLLGGLTAAICHLFNLDSPENVAHLAQYARLSAPVHLVLFAGGMVVLLGWFGHYALQYPASGGIGLAAFVCLFLGIMWGDLLHCILEFSVFPVLETEVPYALPGLADATYRSMPVAALLTASNFLLFGGAVSTALWIYRSAVVPAWPAIPFALTAALQTSAFFSQWSEGMRAPALTALYLSLSMLGLAVLWRAPKSKNPVAPFAEKRKATSCEDSRPVGR